MMRFHLLSPNILPLTNAKKPSTLHKDDDSDHNKLTKIPPFAPKSSPSATPSPVRDDRRSPDPQPSSRPSDASPSTSPSPHTEINGFATNGCSLQWGQNKRSRGSRAEGRSNNNTASSSAMLRRQVVKVQRRSPAVSSAAAMGMPPPAPANCASSSYTRGGNLRPSMAVDKGCRAVEDRSGDKRSSQSPARKSNKSPSKADCVVNPDSKQLSDQETVRFTGGAVTTATATSDKINFDRFELPRIYLTLSKKEKEDDFLAMRGTKLPQRPKKRAKNVDKTLQYCFPGMWLADLTRSRYEVREKKCVKKRRRGLKGMENMDSDSE